MTPPTSGKDNELESTIKNFTMSWCPTDLWIKFDNQLRAILAQSNQAAVQKALEGLLEHAVYPYGGAVRAVSVSAIEAAMKEAK